MSHIRVNGLEGHYTIKRLKKLPKRGNSNWLYTLEKDNMAIYYLWTLDNEYEKICISDSMSFATKIEAGDNIVITGTGTEADPYIINAVPETAAETPVTPTGNIESTNVQDALEELQADIDLFSVQSDWDQTDNTQPDFIQNKPTNTSEFVNDGGDGINLYVQEDNPRLPRIVSGILDNNSGIATFIRDDSSTFDVDFSAFLGGGSITIDSTLSNTSTNALENQEIENNFQLVSQNVSEQIRYKTPGRLFQYYTHSTVVPTVDVSSVPFTQSIVWFNADGRRFMALEDNTLNNFELMQEFFGQSGGLVQAAFTRKNTIFGSAIEFEQRVCYSTLSTDVVTDLVNLPSNYTAFEVQSNYTGNYLLGIGDVLVADLPFCNFSWVKQPPSVLSDSGTITASLEDQGGGATYSINNITGNWNRVGDQVVLNIKFRGVTMTGTPSGIFRINIGSNVIPEVPIDIYNVNITRVSGSNMNMPNTSAFITSGTDPKILFIEKDGARPTDGAVLPLENITFPVSGFEGNIEISATFVTN